MDYTADEKQVAEDTISTPTLVAPDVTTSKTLTIVDKNQQAMAELTASESFVKLVQRVAVLEQASMSVAEMVIESPEQEIALVDLVGQIQTVLNEVDLKRKSIVAFPRLFTETVNALFGTPTGSKGLHANLRRARERVEGPVTRYKMQKQQEQEARRKQEEEERLQRLQDVADGKVSPEDVLGEGIEAPPPLEPQTTETVTKSGSAKLARNLEFAIINTVLVCRAVGEGTIPEECVKVSLVKTKLKQFVKGCDLKGEVVDLPGVKVEEKGRLSVSTKKKEKDNGGNTEAETDGTDQLSLEE